MSSPTATEQVLGSADQIRKLLTDALAENKARCEAAEAERGRLHALPEVVACEAELQSAYEEHGQLRRLAHAMGLPLKDIP